MLNGIVLDIKQGSMERLAAELDFERLINLHSHCDCRLMHMSLFALVHNLKTASSSWL